MRNGWGAQEADMLAGNSSVPPRSKSSSSDLKRALRDKEEKLLDARLKPIAAEAEEAKEIALSAKKEAGSWRNIKFAAVLSFVVFAGVVGGAYFALKSQVENNVKDMIEYNSDMSTVKTDLADVKIDIQEVKVIVEDSKKQSVKKDENQLKQIKSVIAEAFAAQGKKPQRRNR